MAIMIAYKTSNKYLHLLELFPGESGSSSISLVDREAVR